MPSIEILSACERWHCTPSEVLNQPYDRTLMYLANRWGVPPEKVMNEDSVWLARQLFIDKIRNKTHGR